MFSLFFNQTAQLAISDRLEKTVQFFRFSACLHFYSTIEQIAHPASDIKSFCNAPDSVAEPHPLNASFIENLPSGHAPLPLNKAAATCNCRAMQREMATLRLRRQCLDGREPGETPFLKLDSMAGGIFRAG